MRTALAARRRRRSTSWWREGTVDPGAPPRGQPLLAPLLLHAGPGPTSHAPPAGLRFATQPPQSASVSQLIRVDVSVVDSAGVLVAGAETVMVVVALDAGSVSLGGTTTAHPVRGVASFPDLSVNQAGTYRLVASALGFQARSDQFEIRPPPPTTGN